MEKRFFGILRVWISDVLRLSSRSTVVLNTNSIKRSKRLERLNWLYADRRRHHNISVKLPEATSYARATGFNWPAVENFYKLLEETIERHQLDSSRIFNRRRDRNENCATATM